MRLKQEQFIPFMIGVAILTMVIIVFSSFNFTNKQHRQFRENISESDSLTIMPLRKVGEEDRVRVADFKGNKTVLVFWASWSDKSTSMLDEIQTLKEVNDSLIVIAAMVKDAEESVGGERNYPQFIYTDGIHLYNYLKVPGFPSYILFDENSNVLTARIGYEKGIGYDSLQTYFK
jgi:hypothetical protein